MNFISNFILKHKTTLFFIAIILSLLASLGLKKVSFNNDYRIYFGSNNPDYESYESMQNEYGFDMNAFVVIAPDNKEIFQNEILEAINEIVKFSWKLPYCLRVDAITNYQQVDGTGEEIIIENFIDSSRKYTDKELNELKEKAIKNDDLLKKLINKEGSYTGVNISFKLPSNSEFIDSQKELASKYPNPEAKIAYILRNFLKEIEHKYPSIKTHLSGAVMLSHAFYESSFNDLTYLFPLAYASAFLIIFSIFFYSVYNGKRKDILPTALISLKITISVVFIILLAITSTIGLVSLLGLELTPLSAAAPSMILTIAIADCIHILTTYIEELRDGALKKTAILQSIYLNLKPVIITTITTVLGFLSLNFSDSKPFRDLGNVAALGVLIAMLLALTILPYVLNKVSIKLEIPQKKFQLHGFANFIFKNHKKILVISSILTVLFVVLATKNEIDERFVNYFDPSTEFRSSTDVMTKNLSGLYTIEYSLSAGNEGDINNPEYISKLENLKRWFLEKEEVVHVSSYSDLINKMDNAFGIEKSETDKEKNAQNLFLYEMSMPTTLDINNLVNRNQSSTRFTVTVNDISAKQLIDLDQKGKDTWSKINKIKSNLNIGTSTAILFAKLTKIQIINMIEGAIFLTIIITLIVLVIFKRFFIGFISFLGNTLPIIIGFGIWYLINGKITSGLNTVFCITAGVVVDDTVHFLSKYIHAQKNLNLSKNESIIYAITNVGKALITTTITLFLGFLVLSFSSFTLNAEMAILSAIIIFLALIFDLLVLPSVMFAISTKQKLKETK